MTLQLVMPDVVKMTVAFLRAQPEVLALVAEASSIAGKLHEAIKFPAITVTRITSEATVPQPFILESVRTQLDCWGGNNRQAERLGQTARAVMAERMPGFTLDGGYISKVVPASLHDLPDDSMEPVRERYIAELDLFTRAMPVSV